MRGRAVVEAGTTGGARVRLEGCPSCGRPIVLDHCGVVADGAAYVDLAAVDLAAVDFAQRLHLAGCPGR